MYINASFPRRPPSLPLTPLSLMGEFSKKTYVQDRGRDYIPYPKVTNYFVLLVLVIQSLVILKEDFDPNIL